MSALKRVGSNKAFREFVIGKDPRDIELINATQHSLDAEGNYTVTPSRTGYGFTPTSRSLTNLSANQTGADFVGTLQPQPTPTPDPSDDFSAPLIDPTKWNVGVLTQEPAGFDPVRTLAEQRWFPKLRYDVMRPYLATRGARA